MTQQSSNVTDRWQRIEEIFHAALDQPGADRESFIARESIDDQSVAAEVRALLAAHTDTHPLLDAPRVTDLPSGMRLGPYALDRVLGTGGMSTVYLAHRADSRFDKHVAIKLVNQGLAAEVGGDRFRIERQILARLEHPNVARLLDAGVSDFGQPYLVMEWVDGIPLDEWLRRESPSLDARLALWLEIAGAVAYAHRNLVIHRDLKPSNVLVNAEGVPKLVDFGIAKLLSDVPGGFDATRTRHFTPRYASPEQIRGDAVTTSTDIYGLGLLLFEMVTGRLPHDAAAAAPHEHARAVLEEDVRTPATVPVDLRAILEMALRKEPERRYSAVEQFAEDVRRFRRGLPVSAQPETFTYYLRRFVSRNRVGVSVAALVVVSLLGLVGIAMRQARIANDQRLRAEQVTEFITSFLGATPTGPDWALYNKGVSLRVVELADLMTERVGRELSNQPEAEATIRSVLAMSYFQMGELGKARQHSQRAIVLYENMYPEDHPRRLSVEIVEAASELALGRFADAERRAVRVASLWKHPPATAVPVIATQLGTAQVRVGKLAESEKTFLDAIGQVERALGPNHPSLALLASNSSLVYLERGEFEAAARQLERAASISRANFKDASTPLAWSLVNLANAYRFLGRYDDMQRAAEESYEQFKGALGESHFSTVHALVFIAYGKARRGEPDAEAIVRRAIANQSRLPVDHYERAVSLGFLGFVLMQKGQLLEAKQALERALEIRRATFKDPNWRIAETEGWLGETLVKLGDRGSGSALLEKSHGTFTILYGPKNPRTTEARERLASVAGR
jgi:serine/threonine-protein kinase